jgi:hypothetical protein
MGRGPEPEGQWRGRMVNSGISQSYALATDEKGLRIPVAMVS